MLPLVSALHHRSDHALVVLFGYDQGVFSGIVGNQDWKDVFHSPGSALEGIIVSIYNLGAFAGCIICFAFCERWGRRLSMFIAMLFIIVGGSLQACAYTVPHLMVARFITGIGTGIETSTVPMYQSELCEAEKRASGIPATAPPSLLIGSRSTHIVFSRLMHPGTKYVNDSSNEEVKVQRNAEHMT